MIVGEYVYYALLYGVPVAVLVLALILAKGVKAAALRILFLGFGGIAAVAYYI